MTKVSLPTGAYEARSVIAAAQRCVNLYGEKAPEDEEAGFTYYPVPGTRLLSSPPLSGPGRCLHTASNGKTYAVVGRGVYLLENNWKFSFLGNLDSEVGPVRMRDNSKLLIIVDGSTKGYQIDLVINTFNPIPDNTGLFVGANFVEYLDSFMLFNSPGTKEFYSSLSDTVTFDPTYFAQKTSSPDKLAALVVKHREIWLIGNKTTEIWYNVGGAAFPFQSLAGASVDSGTCAPNSVAKDGQSIYWLSRNELGQCMVVRTENYDIKKVSTYALDNELTSYSTVEDAWGFTYQQGGHVFYVLNFPSADKTWVFDAPENQWHERAAIDELGKLHRWRIACHALSYLNKHVVLDAFDGRLSELTLETYTDNGKPMKYIRSFPHIRNDGKRVSYGRFIADMAVGYTPDPIAVELRWSDTKGATWSQPLVQSMGGLGAFHTSLSWTRLGMSRDRVFELSWVADAQTALNGAYIDVTGAAT